MIISDKHKFIYFKAKKVAGTSTEIILSQFCDSNDIVTPISKNHGEQNYQHQPRNYLANDGENKIFWNHVSPREIKSKIGEEKFSSYFRFITIRNPYDRAVSWYCWKNLDRCKCCDRLKQTFKEFIMLDGLAKLYPFSWWAFLDGQYILDDYIKFENLEEDTIRIADKWFDIRNMPYPKTKYNTREVGIPYQEYYDQHTFDVVSEKYKKDIDFFGYSF